MNESVASKGQHQHACQLQDDRRPQGHRRKALVSASSTVVNGTEIAFGDDGFRHRTNDAVHVQLQEGLAALTSCPRKARTASPPYRLISRVHPSDNRGFGQRVDIKRSRSSLASPMEFAQPLSIIRCLDWSSPRPCSISLCLGRVNDGRSSWFSLLAGVQICPFRPVGGPAIRRSPHRTVPRRCR